MKVPTRRGAPPGSVVGMTYDWWADQAEPDEKPPAAGDYLVSQGGSVYGVLSAREMGRPNRFKLSCLKLDGEDAIPADGMVYSVYWARRDRKGRR